MDIETVVEGGVAQIDISALLRSGRSVGAMSSGAAGEVVIVSGLPRSGTSMMMRMLEAGGVPVLVDSNRAPDPDNPNGYYEYEPVLRLKRDSSWMGEAVGKSIKIVYMLIYDLPKHFRYKVIFMERDLEEVVASQEVMLRRRGEAKGDPSATQMMQIFNDELDEFFTWAGAQANLELLTVQYKDVIRNPEAIASEVGRFLGLHLDKGAMALACDPTLHRQKR